ncbi:MAG: N-acetyltransferase family protein [Candidatus Binatia bacterium]
MAANVLIRPARPGDAEALGRLGAMLVRAHHEFDRRRFLAPGDGIEEGYARFLGNQLEDPDVVILVAALDGNVVGYVYAGLEPRSWKELRDVAGFVHDVAVDVSARGQGIAARLVEAAADWLEQRGAPRVMLWTAERNDAGQRLFDRLGFRRTMIEMTREPKGS